ncbi:hypothetical protein HBI51_111440 [Parastagonospora nodorum]|nr:hypothetical protein HBI51_111440 [Parastagonospora nodorum]
MNDTPPRPRRQRAILSCNDCRRRKLKCDRLAPCNRCIKGGVAQSCAYGPEAYSVVSDELQEYAIKKRRRGSRSQQEVQSHIASESRHHVCEQDSTLQPDVTAQDRLEKLERELSLLQQHASTHAPERKDQVEFLANSPDLKGISRSSAVMGILKGRGYGTHFYGASSAMSIVAQFPELRSYMKSAYSESTARRLSQDMKASEDRARQMQQHQRIFNASSLRSLFPERRTVDLLLKKYFDTFESTLRIIHVPTFKKAYEQYWDSGATTDTDMDAIILAILACTICTATHTTPRYNHAGSTFHSKGVLWIRALEAWLKRQSNKRRSLATLQVRCLRLLALATTRSKVKEYYQEVQTHVAIMRSGGMHRDPSIFGTWCSAFEGEMRRRLWATTMDMELQASIDKGVSSVLSGLDYDCSAPRNIDDDELTIDLLALPRSHGITTYTDTAYLHLSNSTLDRRIAICSLMNSLKDKPVLYEILEHENNLNQHITNIPSWADARSIQVKQLLELQLRQFIVILHMPRVLEVDARRESERRYAMITALDAAAATINRHTLLIKTGNFSALSQRLDYLRAILLITHIAYYARSENDNILPRLAKQIFDDNKEKALRLLEERAMRPGKGTEYFWYVSAAVSLVETQFQPSQSDSLKRQAADRVAKLLHKSLSVLDEPTEETLATEVVLGTRPKTPTTTSQVLSEPAPMDIVASAGLEFDAFNFEDTSEFMMDDLWFLNIPPLDDIGQMPSAV